MMGQGFGILLEIWKVTKTVNVRLQRTNGIIPYKILFEDKHVLSETEAETQKYDKIAFVLSALPSFKADGIIDLYVLGWNSIVTFVCCLFFIL